MVILKLRIKTADEWRELAPGEPVTEPIFVPTTDELETGQTGLVETAAQRLPTKRRSRRTPQPRRRAAGPLAIAGRVSYHVPNGGSGLRFVSRDGDGDRRLRELIRRLRAS